MGVVLDHALAWQRFLFLLSVTVGMVIAKLFSLFCTVSCLVSGGTCLAL